MELFYYPTDLARISLVFALGACAALLTGSRVGSTSGRAMAIYLWHSALCIVYALYVVRNGGDAIMYFNDARGEEISFYMGTGAVRVMTHALVDGLGLSFLGTFLAFNIIGCTGLQLVDAALRHGAAGHGPGHITATLLVFLPSVSFWSSAIGKDAPAFLATGMALWAALALRRRLAMMCLSVLLMALVRPHIAGIMLLALGTALLLQLPCRQRLLSAAALSICALLLAPWFLQRAGLTSTDLSGLLDFIHSRQGYNQEGGSSIDITGMSLPMQLFTYLFRPLPFEAHNVFALAASLDNVLLLLVFCTGAWGWLTRFRAIPRDGIAFMLTFGLVSWLILAVTTSNLGISVRKKWMFAPMLLYPCIAAIGALRHPQTPVLKVRAADSEGAFRRNGWR